MPEKPPLLNRQNLVVATVASVVGMILAACTLLAPFVPPIVAVGLAVLNLGVGTWAALLHLPISGMPAPPNPAIPTEEYETHGVQVPEPSVESPPPAGRWYPQSPPKQTEENAPPYQRDPAWRPAPHNEWIDPRGTPPPR